MDHPHQAKHTPDNGKPVHALVNLDIAISAHAGSRSAVAVEHELPMPAEEVANPDVHLEVEGASTNLSPWVLNRIKAFRKSVGISLEGFEAEIIELFLALEAKKKFVLQGESSRKKRGNKTGDKGSRELKSLLSSWNFERVSAISSSVVRDRELVVPQ